MWGRVNRDSRGQATVRPSASLTSAGELLPGTWDNADSSTSCKRWLVVHNYHTARCARRVLRYDRRQWHAGL